MRSFSAEYLRYTRTGMWEDSRAALAGLDLPTRRRVLDVGCGTGELTRVIAEELDGGEVVGVDADRSLLARARSVAPAVAGDATRLPFRPGSFDLVVCQALLINLPRPERAVAEFRRVSSELVAAIEPDNAAVAVDSTVDAERRLEPRMRAAYLAGVETDPTLGAVDDLFDSAGLTDVQTRRYDHVRVVEPPYSEDDLAAARRKATGAAIEDGRETLRRALSPEAYDDLRADWRAMGRAVIEAMQEGEYRREETVPFHVTVGRVPGGG